MKHFLLMLLFAAVVALVLAVVGRENQTSQVRYGIKIFFEFVVIGFGLAWVLYFI